MSSVRPDHADYFLCLALLHILVHLNSSQSIDRSSQLPSLCCVQVSLSFEATMQSGWPELLTANQQVIEAVSVSRPQFGDSWSPTSAATERA